MQFFFFIILASLDKPIKITMGSLSIGSEFVVLRKRSFYLSGTHTTKITARLASSVIDSTSSLSSLTSMSPIAASNGSIPTSI